MASTMIPKITDYQDYRCFLRDHYLYKKSLRKGFSFRRFSQMVGLKSPNYLQLVMKGSRNLSHELAEQVARVLGLTVPERSYFIALVDGANAQDENEQKQALRNLMAASTQILKRDIPKAKSKVLQDWSYLVVRELTFLRDFDPDPKWISQKLHGLITPEKAEEALRLLLKTEFLVRTPEGRLVASDPVLDSGDALDGMRIMQTHLQLFQVWKQRLPELRPDQRDLGYLNIPLHHSKIPELKKRIERFHDEIIGWLQDESDADTLVQLGTYMIPLT